eukprot:TRINITY_DN27169_c0_g1_i1.p1 TRINITY_DN27169_c0_g1~~TRINITY_DN27169_c0_g1_i1.p1  ORF type:complete len:394 (-),score=74.51 TRINITY_DN27169_c0_g1_i1:86-1267(-)
MTGVKAEMTQDSADRVTRDEDVAPLTLVDAEVAVLYSLHQGVALGAWPAVVRASRGSSSEEIGAEEEVLSGKVLNELLAWLDFLATVLPTDRARKELNLLAGDVRQATAPPSVSGTRGGSVTAGIGTRSLSVGRWEQLLEGRGLDLVPAKAGRHPEAYWRLCRTYTCGLWVLFHLLTIAVAEGWREVNPVGDSKTGNGKGKRWPTPAVALERIRGFVEHFFGCSDCVSHFLAAFDGCFFGRCELEPQDGLGSALWLWRMHNNVSARLQLAPELGTIVRPVSPKAPSEPFALWPPSTNCRACRSPAAAAATTGIIGVGRGEDVSWNEQQVYTHLRQTYWHHDWLVGPSTPRQPVSDMGIVHWVGALVVFVALVYIFVFFGTRTARLKGDHKKGS